MRGRSKVLKYGGSFASESVGNLERNFNNNRFFGRTSGPREQLELFCCIHTSFGLQWRFIVCCFVKNN
jgi:hypothetical protein